MVEGVYELTVSHKDYLTISRKVEIRRDKTGVLNEVLVGLPGWVWVSATPQAEVWENSRKLGLTGSKLDGFAAGEHVLEVRRRGYRTERLTVQVPPNGSARETLGELVRERGSIQIEYQIENKDYRISKGKVRIDGGEWKEVALPHTVEDLGCESHSVELQLDDWTVNAAQTVVVKDSETASVVFELVPEPSVVTIECNEPDAEIWQKGVGGLRLIGKPGDPLSLMPFIKQKLEISENGFKTRVIELTLDAPGKDFGIRKVALEKWNGPETGRKWKAQLGSGVEMEFMPIEAGSFQMGSNSGDEDEKPVHRVTLSKPFWMASKEVTQRQYKQVTGKNPSHFQGLENPVEQVSWNDAVSFCKKLTEIERKACRLPAGFEYVLPTEAQWEYACRAGTTGKYAGNLDSMAWYSENSGSKTHPAGTKTANAWGLYDMHGNVWEWCLDDWHGSYDGAPSNGSRWGDGSGSYRVNRGGSWYDSSSLCRSANRGRNSPDYADNGLGFRPLVLER